MRDPGEIYKVLIAIIEENMATGFLRNFKAFNKDLSNDLDSEKNLPNITLLSPSLIEDVERAGRNLHFQLPISIDVRSSRNKDGIPGHMTNCAYVMDALRRDPGSGDYIPTGARGLSRSPLRFQVVDTVASDLSLTSTISVNIKSDSYNLITT